MPDRPDPERSSIVVLIADDHHLIREAVKPHLRRLAREVVFLEAGTYEDVLKFGYGLKRPPGGPDIALVDLDMPDSLPEDRFKGLRETCQALPDTAVVVFSGADDAETIAAALQCGARGYVPKSVQGRSLTSAIRLVLDGEVYVPVEATRHLGAIQTPPAGDASNPFKRLTSQEHTSMEHMVNGLTNKEIARLMSLQEVTVKMHLRNAYRKLGVANRVSAVRLAVTSGFAGAIETTGTE